MNLNRLIDKLALALLGFLVAVILETDMVVMIVSLLTAIIVSSVSQYSSNKIILYILHGIYALLSIFINGFFFLFALSVYEVIYSENKYAKLIFSLLPLTAFINNSVTAGIAVTIMCITAILLAIRTCENEKLSEKIITLRDNSEENQQLLLERNKYLAMGRDNEINLAIMSERNRIAREIHDNVGHMLSRTLLQMGALKVINKDENLTPHLEEINNSLNTAMTSMRESVHNLHDDSVSLAKTIRELAEPLEENFEVRLDMDISEKTPKEIKLTIIGIVKEAVSNIIRHSNGNRVIIIIREHPAFYQLSVEDNGKNSSIINQDGIGLENMKSRTDNLGGIFKYYTEQDKFKIFVSVPKERR